MDKIIEWNDKLMSFPAGVLTFLMSIAVGYVWKNVKVLANRFIPGLVMLTAAVLFLLLNWKEAAGVAVHVRFFVVGFIIGFAAWLAHNQVLKRIETKLGLFQDDDNKPTTPPTPTQ